MWGGGNIAPLILNLSSGCINPEERTPVLTDKAANINEPCWKLNISVFWYSSMIIDLIWTVYCGCTRAEGIALRGTNTPVPVCACVRGLPRVRNQYRESCVGSWLEKGNESVRVDDEFHCVRGEGLASCCTIQYTAENTLWFSVQCVFWDMGLNPECLNTQHRPVWLELRRFWLLFTWPFWISARTPIFLTVVRDFS
jgi:hypothetical protein